MTQLRFLVVELLMLVRKASEIARFLRQDNQLLTLLTQQKTCDLSKRHFVRDFKTLADVIIQQLVIERLRSLLPRFGPISGEESDLFQCPDGRLIRVRVSPDRDQLTAILRQLIPDFDCCDRLAAVILNEPPTDDIESLLIDQIPNDLIIDESQLGVWIDPIGI